jgi:transcription elongation factor Elf1
MDLPLKGACVKRRKYKTGFPVLCPKCRKRVVFYATGTDLKGDVKINVFCKTCNREVAIDISYIKKTLTPSESFAT